MNFGIISSIIIIITTTTPLDHSIIVITNH